jgi:hypothetical protein
MPPHINETNRALRLAKDCLTSVVSPARRTAWRSRARTIGVDRDRNRHRRGRCSHAQSESSDRIEPISATAPSRNQAIARSRSHEVMCYELSKARGANERELPMATRTKKRTMSDDHKAALAKGREQSRAVANYLEALELNKPKRGRKRTLDTVKRQLAETTAALEEAGGIARVELIQRRRDLEVELAAMQAGGGPDLTALEKAFVKHGKGYAQRKGISRATFREFGVPAEVLKRAGIA